MQELRPLAMEAIKRLVDIQNQEYFDNAIKKNGIECSDCMATYHELPTLPFPHNFIPEVKVEDDKLWIDVCPSCVFKKQRV